MNRTRLAGLALLAAAGTVQAVPLTPAACGVRHTLWIEHYAAQLCVPAGASVMAVGDPAQPKMLRMRVLNTFLMPPDIPRKWRDGLEPVLDGDTVVVTSQPQNGTALRINDRTVVSAEGHAAIDALLAAWADDAPVRKKLAGAASRNRCA
jgi:hypothetical protein